MLHDLNLKYQFSSWIAEQQKYCRFFTGNLIIKIENIFWHNFKMKLTT